MSTPTAPPERFKCSELSTSLHDRQEFAESPLSPEQTRKLVDAFFGIVAEEISKGGRVEIRGFGSFFMRRFSAVKKFDPVKRVHFEKKSSIRIRFKPSNKTVSLISTEKGS